MESVQSIFEAEQIQSAQGESFQPEMLSEEYKTIAIISAGVPVRVMLARDVHTDELVLRN
jgi:hypothetical protein